MKTVLTLPVDYDPAKTDPDALATAMDRLMETILSTPGIIEEYGDPRIGEFLVAPVGLGETESPLVVVEIEDGVLQNIYANATNVRVAAIDYDTEGCTDEDPGVVRIKDGLACVTLHDPLPLEAGAPVAEALNAAGIAWAAQASPPSTENVLRRWVLYNDDTQQLLSLDTFDSYEAALNALDLRLNNVLVLPIEVGTIAMGSPEPCDCQSPGPWCSGVPGILAHIEAGKVAPDTEVQRCDQCQRYDSDEAALAKLKELGYVSPP